MTLVGSSSSFFPFPSKSGREKQATILTPTLQDDFLYVDKEKETEGKGNIDALLLERRGVQIENVGALAGTGIDPSLIFSELATRLVSRYAHLYIYSCIFFLFF